MSNWLNDQCNTLEWEGVKCGTNKLKKLELQLEAANAVTKNGKVDPDCGATLKWRDHALKKLTKQRSGCAAAAAAPQPQIVHGLLVWSNGGESAEFKTRNANGEWEDRKGA